MTGNTRLRDLHDEIAASNAATADAFNRFYELLNREIRAANLYYDETQRHLDEHGYCHCDEPEPREVVGLGDYIPRNKP